MTDNTILRADVYKYSQPVMYPPGMTGLYSYFESRTGAKYPETCFFGLQYYLQRYLSGVRVTTATIGEATRVLRGVFGKDVFDSSGWEWIRSQHGGRLPLRIKAVPEGTCVPTGNVLLTVECTDAKVAWLTNWAETLLCQVWYSSTVATQSRHMKQLLLAGLEKSGDPGLIESRLIDFGFRGVSCPEQAGLGCAAHLLNFTGTDTIPGVLLLQEHYGAGNPGTSIPASEHSTITTWGRACEADAYANVLAAYPTGTVACVSDSWDIEEACRDIWGGVLRERVRDRKGTLVIRPDSGDPVIMLPRLLNILGSRFGDTVNRKGYRLLPDCVRLLQGDGVKVGTLGAMIDSVIDAGWSLDNISFGSGGGLLQNLNRDTQRFAFKASSVTIDGDTRPVYKQPAGDPSKASKRGRLMLTPDFRTVREGSEPGDLLQTVFLDGVVTPDSFDAIRKRVT